MVPGSLGAFSGAAKLRLVARNHIGGALVGCTLFQLPLLACLSLLVFAGRIQNESELTTTGTLGMFSIVLCVFTGGVTGTLFAISDHATENRDTRHERMHTERRSRR